MRIRRNKQRERGRKNKTLKGGKKIQEKEDLRFRKGEELPSGQKGRKEQMQGERDSVRERG